MRVARCYVAIVARASGVVAAKQTLTPTASIWCSPSCVRAWRLKRAGGFPFFVDRRLRLKWTTPRPQNTVSTRQFGNVIVSKLIFLSPFSLSLSLSLFLSFSLVVADDRCSKKWDESILNRIFDTLRSSKFIFDQFDDNLAMIPSLFTVIRHFHIENLRQIPLYYGERFAGGKKIELQGWGRWSIRDWSQPDETDCVKLMNHYTEI